MRCSTGGRITRWIIPAVAAMAAAYLFAERATDPHPAWAGKGSLRLLLAVAPVDLPNRQSDEMPAVVRVDFDHALKAAGIKGQADLSTLQIMRYDPASGKPLAYGNYLFGETESDRPLQWYDDAIPDPFPDRDRSAASPWVYRPSWGYYYDVIGDWKRGRLAWSHTQDGAATSYYAAYFDLRGEGEKQQAPPPRGWIGDGSKRTARLSKQSTGLYHVDCQMADLNGDGLLDLICGCSRGGIVWYENLGSRQKPRFAVARLLFYADGRPIDVGFLSTPTAVDWDQDGKLDLIVGANKGWIYFYRNVGTTSSPVYEDRGPLEVDGKALRVPTSPVPEVEGPNGESIYKEDYQPYCAVADWDGDGDDDLLVGGNVTGRIFWYENKGRRADGTLALTFRGHLMADGKPLDVGWSANLAVGDIDGDGDLDLMAGRERKWGNETPPEIVEDFLAYFENVGTRTNPVLTMKPLPRIGKFPDEINASPTLADWDGDGDLDLAVSSYLGPVYLFENAGTARRPKFDVRHPEALKMPWGNDLLPNARELTDWDGDGIADLVQGHTIALGLTNRLPWKFGPFQSMLPADQVIDHRAWRGDDWEFTVAVDFDQDARKDILFGDYQGHVWFHRNTSSGRQTSFDTKGVLIRTAAGKPLTVGRTASQPYDFDTMQGPRTSLVAADFDGDGSIDLVLNDVYGHFYFCRRGKYGKEPVVESQVLFADVGNYAATTVTDWDGDGRLDIVASLPRPTQHHVLFRNRPEGGSQPPFSRPERVELPIIPVVGSVVKLFLADANRDGDRDVILSSGDGYDCLFEDSFLKRGYAQGRLAGLERRQP
ncbi:MAG: VCBS repeat-containing protein [Acidobacteria bacterium]|nr:VCBS repeat-containing protein [Acidobacteriota bacterium]